MQQSPHVVESTGQAEDEKITQNVSSGVPAPHFVPDWPDRPKASSFADDAPNHFIADLMVNVIPPGQFDAVLHYCRTLAYAQVDSELERNLKIAEATKKCTLASAPIDHVLAPSLKEQLDAHQSERYSSKHALTCSNDISIGTNQPDEIIVRTYVEMIDGDNRRTGSWSGYWSVVAEDQQGDAQVSGQVEIKIYSHENSNTHMNCTQAFQPVMVQSYEQLATAIVRQISSWEDGLLDSVKNFYQNEVDSNLKQIRRVLPITRTKMKWEVATDRAVKIHQAIQRY